MPSSVQRAFKRTGTLACGGHRDLPQFGRHGLVAPFDEQALGGITPPAVRVGKRGNELRGVGARQRGRRAGLFRLVDDPIDAAIPETLVELTLDDLAPQEARHVLPVLEDAAVEIDDVQRAVRSGVGVDRTKALVGGREEFPSFVRVVRAQNSVLLLDDRAPNDMTGRLRREVVAVEFGGEVVTAVDAGTT